MKRRNILKLVSVSGASVAVASELLRSSALDLAISQAYAQTALPDSFVGIDIKAKYINGVIPSPIDVLISEAFATHIPVPNPWTILATRASEDTYTIEILDPGSQSIRAGSFNIDGSKSPLERVDDRSCKKARGKMTKAFIRSVSSTGMIFQVNYQRDAELNWALIPGEGVLEATGCS